MKRKHYWWRYLLFVLLGIFLGIGCVVGGVAAAGFIINGEQIEKWTGQDIFTDDYQGKSVIDLIMTLSSNQEDLTTLGGLAKITPIVDQMVDSVNEMLEQNIGFSYSKEELYQVKFQDIGDYLLNTLKDGATVARMIGAGPDSSNIMKLFLFPKDDGGNYDFDHPYTLSDFMSAGFFDGIIDRMVISDIIENIDESNALLNAIKNWGLADFQNQDKIYGLTISQLMGDISPDNSLLYALRNWSINDLKDGDKVYSLTIEELMGDIDPNNDLLNAIKTWTINDLKDGDKVYTLTISQLMGDIDPDNNLLNAIKNWTINDLKDGDKIYTLTITELMGDIDPSNTLLYAIRNWTIDDLKDEDKIYDELTIKDLVGDIDPNNTVLVAIQNWTIRELMDDDSINGLTIEELLGEVDPENAVLYAFKDMTISQFKNKDALNDKVNNLKISDIITNITADNSFLYAVKDWKIEDLKNNDKINALTITQILGEIPANNSLLNAIKTWSINDLKDVNKINTLTISQILGDIPEDNALLNAIKTWTINDLKDVDKIKTLTIRQVLGDDDVAASKILTAIADIEIGNLKDEIELLPIEDFIDIDPSNRILSALEGTPLADLSTAINSLSLGDVFDPADFVGKEALYNFLSGYTVETIGSAINDITIGVIIPEEDRTGIFKYLDPDTSIYDFSDAVKNIKIVEAFEDDIFTKGGFEDRDDWQVNAVWKFMLTPAGTALSPAGTKFGVDPNKNAYLSYTVGSGLGTMVDNFNYHVQNENIATLSGAGLVSVNASFLTRVVPPLAYATLNGTGEGKIDFDSKHGASTTYGELTVSELMLVLDYVTTLIP